MSKKETRIYKNGWKPEAEEAAKKFGFMTTSDVVRKNISTSTIEQILTGWGNLVKSHFVDLNPELKAESESRLKKCNSCVHLFCTDCIKKINKRSRCIKLV